MAHPHPFMQCLTSNMTPIIPPPPPTLPQCIPPYLHKTCQLEYIPECPKIPTPHGCHHVLDFMNKTPPTDAMVLESHRVNKDVDVVTELGTTPMEDMVEFPALECNPIISLLH